MAHIEGGLIYVLDANIGTPVSGLLRAARVLRHEQIRTLQELGISPDAPDAELLACLGRTSGVVVLTRDGRMLDPQIQRQAWKDAGVVLFLLGKRWALLPFHELTRRMLYLWPRIIDHAEASAPGQAWRVSPSIPNPAANTFRLVTGRHDDPGEM